MFHYSNSLPSRHDYILLSKHDKNQIEIEIIPDLVLRLKVLLVEPVHIIKVILSSVHQLDVVPVLVGVLDGAVRPESLDGINQLRVEGLAVLPVLVLLDLQHHILRGLTLTLNTINPGF